MTEGQGSSEGLIRISSSTPLIDKYRMDQMNAEHNVTDMQLACEDGYVPVHRYLLMGISPLLQGLLENEDPSELAVLHLCGTKVSHAVQLMTLVYYGKCVVQNAEDKDRVFCIMRDLGISSKKMQYRKSNGLDQMMIPKIRYFQTATHEDIEMETTFVDAESLDQALVPNGSGGVDDSAVPQTKRRRMGTRQQPSLPSNEEHRLGLPNSDGIHECCACPEKFDSHEGLVDHVQTSCGLDFGPFYDYDDRKCLLCGKIFTPEFLIWGILNHVVECHAASKDAAQQLAKSRTALPLASTSSGPIGGMVFNGDGETTESRPRAVSVVSIDSSVNSSQQSLNQEEHNAAPTLLSLSSNEIEVVEVSDNDQSSCLNNSMDKNNEHILNEDEIPPLVDSQTAPEAMKSKRSPIVRKRRRRKPLVYKSHPKRPKASTATSTASAATSTSSMSTVTTPPSKITPLNGQKEKEVPTTLNSSSQVVEIEEDDKQSDISTCCLIPDINSHMLRSKLGLSPSSPLTELSADTIHSILHECPLCNNEFERLKDVTKCLRYHGYRYCYACLQILPCQGDEFTKHWLNAHNISLQVDLKDDSPRKVPCPFCSKEYEFRSALATHLGNYHCARLSEGDDEEYYSGEDPQSFVEAAASPASSFKEVNSKTQVTPALTCSRPDIIVHTSSAVATAIKKTNAAQKKTGGSVSSADLSFTDTGIILRDVKSLAGDGEPSRKKKLLTVDTTEETKPIATTSNARKTSTPTSQSRNSPLSNEEIVSVVFMNDSSSEEAEEDDLNRRSSLDTPSSISLSEVIEDNVSSAGLSSAGGSTASSARLLLGSRRRRSSNGGTDIEVASTTSSTRSSQRSLNTKVSKPRGSKSSTSSRGSGNSSSRSNSSRKSDSRKLDANAQRLKAILGSVKIADLQQRQFQQAAGPSLPPPSEHLSQRGKRTSRGKPQRLIESDFEEEQQNKRRAMFPKPSQVLHHSQPGSRRNSTMSVESLEHSSQRNVDQLLSTSKPTEYTVQRISGSTSRNKSKDRPLHIIKAGVAPESVIISGRSTPSMTSDCGSESSFGGASKSVVAFPHASPFDVATAAAGASSVRSPQDIDNISVSSSSSSTNSFRGRLTFLHQRKQDGVLHNVYCKVGQPSKKIHIPVEEDPATYNNSPD